MTEEAEARVLERGAVLLLPPDREVAERKALPLRPPVDIELDPPTADELLEASPPIEPIWDPEEVEPAALAVEVDPPPLEPPEDPPIELPPPSRDDRPLLELPEDPRPEKEPEGPPRPKPLRLPRICGVMSDTNFSACVVPVRRRIFSIFPPFAVAVRVAACVAVGSLPVPFWTYSQPAAPAITASKSSHHFPKRPGSGATAVGGGAGTGCGGVAGTPCAAWFS
jgi:hypothetical protein